jgi:hypothetical protein
MPDGSINSDHTFNKETAPISHENSAIHRTNFHSAIQVHEHYKTQERGITKNTENTRKNTKMRKIH